MAITNIQYPPFQGAKAARKPRRVSWKVFEKKYLTREDSWKYEWVNGIIEKTKRTMYPHHHFILFNLRNLFYKLQNEKKVSGSFEPEMDIFILENVHRRPDISYFSLEQVALMAHGELPTPEFIIEIVSSNDVLPKDNQKMKHYREAGIKVVWQIFPKTQEVHIIRGKDSTICTHEQICSAAPVLPDYKIAAKDVFEKPPKPG